MRTHLKGRHTPSRGPRPPLPTRKVLAPPFEGSSAPLNHLKGPRTPHQRPTLKVLGHPMGVLGPRTGQNVTYERKEERTYIRYHMTLNNVLKFIMFVVDITCCLLPTTRIQLEMLFYYVMK